MKLTRLDRALLLAVTMALFLRMAPASAAAQTTALALDSADGLVVENVMVEPVTHKGKKGIKVLASGGVNVEPVVLVKGVEFGNGTIELEVAGLPREGAPGQARGFVGLSFRVSDGGKTYDCFYIRPTNGRAEDQLRRNHSVQYTSHPDWPWNRLRKETPGMYETYADLVPGEWTRMKVVVDGEKARLYVHGVEQPTLIVNDVKSGPNAKGGVGLWLNGSTEAYFRDLKITPSD